MPAMSQLDNSITAISVPSGSRGAGIGSDRYTFAWEALHRFRSATMDAIPSPPPHSISLGGLRTPAPGARRATVMGPASANLHTSGHAI
jgi:hypothetical protein